MTGTLPRAAGGPVGGRRARVLCLGLDPDPAALPAGFSPRPRRRRAVRRAHPRGGRAVRRRGQAEPRLLRGVRVGRAGGPRADPRAVSGRPPGRRRRQARRHRLDRGAPGGRPVRRPRRRRGHGQPVPRRRGDRAAPRARRTGSPTSCAGPRTRAPASSRASSSRRTRRPAPRPSRSTCASPGASPTWGPGGTVGLVVGATAPAELAAIRAIAPGLAFLVPGVGAQGGESSRSCATARRRAAPAGGRPGGGLLVNVSRGIAGAALGDAATGGPGDPGERLAAAAARLGFADSLCYPSPRRGPARAHDRASRTDPDPQEQRRSCLHPDPSSWSSSW